MVAKNFKGILLGLDFGLKKLGVAIGNTYSYQAKPLKTIFVSNKTDRIKAVKKEILEWDPNYIVVGVPFLPNGAKHPFAEKCEKFAIHLEKIFKINVILEDERWSSALAKGDGPDDARAAAIILQGVLNNASINSN